MLYIYELIFDEWNIDHIAAHGVIPQEVEEVCLSRPYVSKTRQDRLRVIGQTEGGRYLTVILARRGKGTYYRLRHGIQQHQKDNCISVQRRNNL